MQALRHLFAAAGLLAVCTHAALADPVLFDNGSFSGSQEGRNASGLHWVIDDFFLAASSVVTAIEWTQHDDLRLPYDFTELAIFATFPTSANPWSWPPPVASFTVAATRTPNGTPVIFQFLHGFDYVVSGLSINLEPGTYWLAIRSQFPGGGATWDQTTGMAATIPGRYQFTDTGGGPEPPRFYPLENSAFRVLGTPSPSPSPVPEPPAVVYLALALGILVLRRAS